MFAAAAGAASAQTAYNSPSSRHRPTHYHNPINADNSSGPNTEVLIDLCPSGTVNEDYVEGEEEASTPMGEKDPSLRPPKKDYNPETIYGAFRKACFDFFTLQTCLAAKLFGYLIIISILSSVVIEIIRTLPVFRKSESFTRFIVVYQISLLVLWTFELLGKFFGTPRLLLFFKSGVNWIDIITLISFYLDTLVSFSNFLAGLRLIRLSRVLLLLRGSSASVKITLNAIRRSFIQILVVFIFLAILVIFSSTIMYYVEQDYIDSKTGLWMRTNSEGQLEISPFQSILHSFYWAIVTLSTTGYGDIVPVTPLGRLVAGLTMVSGILLIALPTSILGSNFVQEWETYTKQKKREELALLRKQQDYFLNGGAPGSGGGGGRQSLPPINWLKADNERLYTVINNIQDQLAEINPPNYYQEYQSSLYKCRQLTEELVRTKQELMRLQQQPLQRQRSDTWPGYSLPVRSKTTRITSFARNFLSRRNTIVSESHLEDLELKPGLTMPR